MRQLAIAAAAFVAMEPMTAATHRFVMHGVGMRLHRSHHRALRRGRRVGAALEANDAFPVMFAALVGIGLFVGFNNPAWSDLVPLGVGVTVYGAAYALIHDVYIHGRLRWFGERRIAVLEHLAAAHRVHHRTSGAPYGMLLPVVPRRSSATGSRPAHVPADA